MTPLYDKQNEGIKDSKDKEILYDMGGWVVIRSWGIEKVNHNEMGQRLVK